MLSSPFQRPVQQDPQIAVLVISKWGLQSFSFAMEGN